MAADQGSGHAGRTAAAWPAPELPGETVDVLVRANCSVGTGGNYITMQVEVMLAHRNIVQKLCNPLRIHHLRAIRAGGVRKPAGHGNAQ